MNENEPKIELKPCPFCGGDAELKNLERRFEPWECSCNNPECDAIAAAYGSTPEEAAENWNRRAGDEPNR